MSLSANFTPRLRALQYILQFLDDHNLDRTAAILREEAYVPESTRAQSPAGSHPFSRL
jgi:hypothetical protein